MDNLILPSSLRNTEFSKHRSARDKSISSYLFELEHKIAVDILQFIADIKGQRILVLMPDDDGIDILIHADRSKSIFSKLIRSRIESYAVELTKRNPLPQYAVSIKESTTFASRDFCFVGYLSPVFYQVNSLLDEVLVHSALFSKEALEGLENIKKIICSYMLISYKTREESAPEQSTQDIYDTWQRQKEYVLQASESKDEDLALEQSKQNAIDYWQDKKDNADNFPEYLSSHVMGLNAEVGYGIAEGAKAAYETVTDLDKLTDAVEGAVDGVIDAVTHPKETYEKIEKSAKDFYELPAGEKGDALYKGMSGTLAGGGVGKGATAFGKLGKKKIIEVPNSHIGASLHPNELSKLSVLDRADNEIYRYLGNTQNGCVLGTCSLARTQFDRLSDIDNGRNLDYIRGTYTTFDEAADAARVSIDPRTFKVMENIGDMRRVRQIYKENGISVGSDLGATTLKSSNPGLYLTRELLTDGNYHVNLMRINNKGNARIYNTNQGSRISVNDLYSGQQVEVFKLEDLLKNNGVSYE